ncbi:hypothetical protein D3C77_776740 [compost metagenome]
MPMAVVYPLEVVDIEHDGRKSPPFGLQQRQAEFQVAAVTQPGQWVGLGIVVQPADALLKQVESK